MVTSQEDLANTEPPPSPQTPHIYLDYMAVLGTALDPTAPNIPPPSA